MSGPADTTLRGTFRPTSRELLERLTDEGHWDPTRDREAEALLAEHLVHEAPHPWYVRLLATAGAWGSAISVTGLLGLLEILDDAASCLVFGALLLIAATSLRWLVRQRPRTFPVQLALAGLVTGEVLVIGAVAMELEGEAWMIVGAALHALMVLVYPDRLSRFLSTLTACVLGAWWIYELDHGLPLHIVSVALLPLAVRLMEDEAALERSPLAEARGPVAMGIIGAMFCSLIFGLWAWRDQSQWVWLTTGGLTAGAIWLGWRITRTVGIRDARAAWLYLGLAALGLLTWNVPGIIAATATMTLGFHRRDPVLTGASTLFLSGFLFFLYYDLDLSLLAKSLTLVSSGALLLGARWLLPRDPAAADRDAAGVF